MNTYLKENNTSDANIAWEIDEIEKLLSESATTMYKSVIDPFYKSWKSTSQMIAELRRNINTQQDRRVISEEILKDENFKKIIKSTNR